MPLIKALPERALQGTQGPSRKNLKRSSGPFPACYLAESEALLWSFTWPYRALYPHRAQIAPARPDLGPTDPRGPIGPDRALQNLIGPIWPKIMLMESVYFIEIRVVLGPKYDMFATLPQCVCVCVFVRVGGLCQIGVGHFTGPWTIALPY